MSFDTLAPIYQWMENVCAGSKLQTCRTAHLHALPPPESILLLGEGHGHFLLACRLQFPRARITSVDTSANMIARAKETLAGHPDATGTIEFIHADILDWTPPPAAYDLIVTHFFLDCFRADQLALIVPKLGNAARAQAHWLLADFQLAPAGWRRLRSRCILWLLYRFFRITTGLPATQLTVPDPYLQAAGFHLHQRTETEWALLKSDWWQRT